MKITIIREDGAVYKDNYSYLDLDLSSVPIDVHALQFNTASNTGWIEFVSSIPNENITELPNWVESCLIKWDEAEAARLAAEEAAAAKQAKEV